MRQVLTFTLGEELYGLEISAIQEIVEAPALFYIPGADDRYLGAINFHGSIVPVLNLARLLGFSETEPESRIIVTCSEIAVLGLAVGRLGEIVVLDEAETLPGDADQRRANCIGEVVDLAGRMINLFDMTAFLSRLEML
ncbi:chemotaxis protein CheW [Geothermobacter hydrogeniphilus]|uniref:CheW-like domain-containing protein n=1 Tax=Geothermobacter hydrogeniphilus TaxID=1969733 RepID=A0A1X0YAQ6_9BACT|nr:chemotaxis protein CheW [Geothermobacter hydrogeniphilus]ORJ62196.1 hypothetical protein B5V00_05470 [Geothermobacter hydrogeniphilus]